MEKDISYINDSIKDEVSMYKTSYLNKRNKQVVTYLLSKIKNLHLSYKLSSPFQSFYKSSLINDLNLEIIKPETDNFDKSNIYNELRLGEKLDLYNLYGEKDEVLSKLLTHYNIPYKTYSNAFQGINNDKYLETLPYPLKLSYTSLNSYSECKFKYYLKNVLKLEPFEKTFPSFIGTMYHEILRLYRKTNFDFEEEYQNFNDFFTRTIKEEKRPMSHNPKRFISPADSKVLAYDITEDLIEEAINEDYIREIRGNNSEIQYIITSEGIRKRDD